MGLFAAAVATGGVVGPLISGMCLQHLGFRVAFSAFALLAALGAAIFTLLVPETARPRRLRGTAVTPTA